MGKKIELTTHEKNIAALSYLLISEQIVELYIYLSIY